MKVTKIEAGGQQLDAAIDHFLKEQWVPAIHCAGAAEELCSGEIEKHGGKKLLDDLWEKHDFSDLVAHKKDYVKVSNLFRDWVKHANGQHPDGIEIEDWHAFGIVMRASIAYGRLRKLGVAPPREALDHLMRWFSENEKRLNEFVESLPD